MHKELNRGKSISRIIKSHERHEEKTSYQKKVDPTVESIMRLDVVKLMPEDEKNVVIDEAFRFPLNPTLRKVEKSAVQKAKDREPDMELEQKLAENGYDDWLDDVKNGDHKPETVDVFNSVYGGD